VKIGLLTLRSTQGQPRVASYSRDSPHGRTSQSITKDNRSRTCIWLAPPKWGRLNASCMTAVWQT